VRALSERKKVKVAAVYELATHEVNAFAVPGRRLVIFTGGALATLDDAELEAVAAHELGHLTEARAVCWLRMLRSVLLFPLAAVRPLVNDLGSWPAAGAGIAVFFALRALNVSSRQLESRADHVAAGEGAGDYARALEHLYEANLVPAVLQRPRTHPDLYDRLVAIGHTPRYPRPAPPDTPPVSVLAVLAMTLTLVFAHRGVWAYATTNGVRSEVARVALIAFGGGHDEVGALARSYKDPDGAALLESAAQVVLQAESTPSGRSARRR
jgi:hypothetical protein